MWPDNIYFPTSLDIKEKNKAGKRLERKGQGETILNEIFRESLCEVTFEQRAEWWTWEFKIWKYPKVEHPGKEKRKCKGHEAKTRLKCLRNTKKNSVTEE